MNPLTDRQRQILTVVDDFAETHGFPPSVREIRDAVGFASTNSAWAQIHRLELKGVVTRDPSRHRTLRLASSVVRSRNGLMASITPVERCGVCEQDMPAGHRHLIPQETPNG